MRTVARNEILDLGAYEQVRSRFLERIIQMKKKRRLTVGEHMTFIFENRETVMFQIQEMLRVERITKEAAIQHELSTYNTMVPGTGELFTTLMIEYVDPIERKKALDSMPDLKHHVHFVIGETRAQGSFELLPGEEDSRLPSVNYVRFTVGDATAALLDESVPARLELDHPQFTAALDLPMATRRELAEDLGEP